MHANHILCNIIDITEETRLVCWTIQDHMKMNKIFQWYQLIVSILNRFGQVGNKIDGYEVKNFDSHFNMNFLSFCTYQMSILISDIQSISWRLCFWVEMTTMCKKQKWGKTEHGAENWKFLQQLQFPKETTTLGIWDTKALLLKCHQSNVFSSITELGDILMSLERYKDKYIANSRWLSN